MEIPVFDPGNGDRIPSELRECKQWVNWHYARRQRQPGVWEVTKLPLRPHSYRRSAKSNDPSTWATYSKAGEVFEKAVADPPGTQDYPTVGGQVEGVGFMFSKDDPYVGIDFDDCLDDKKNIHEWVTDILSHLPGYYGEFSPGGKGIKIIVKAALGIRLPDGTSPRGKRCKKGLPIGEIEIYSATRYFTITTQTLQGSTNGELPDCQEQLDKLCGKLWPRKSRAHGSGRATDSSARDIDDDALLEKARKAKNGGEFVALFDKGEMSAYAGDASSADQALCNKLAWWTQGDADRIDRLFRRSALCRDKWMDRQDYREATIRKAIESCSGQFYNPGRGNAAGQTQSKGSRDANDRAPPPTKLLRLVRGNPAIEMFHPPGDHENAYVTVPVGGHRETLHVRSKAFQIWLRKVCFEAYTEVFAQEVFSSVTNTIEGFCLHGGVEHPVAMRVGEHEGCWYIDLGNENWEVVKISNGAREIISKSPVRFTRPGNMRALSTPVRDVGMAELWRLFPDFINVTDEDEQRLVITTMIAHLTPVGPYPILTMNGEHGSAKSSSSRRYRELVDPNKAPLRRPPRKEEDLIVAVHNNHVLAFENVSKLPDWLSDDLCTLATGGGFAVRELYTNLEECAIDGQRAILTNGIPKLTGRGDFVDRCVAVTLPPIGPERRQEERLLNSRWEKLRPRIQGALFDLLAKTHSILPTIKLERLPRMADFAILGTAVERAAGWPKCSFLRAYASNTNKLNELALEETLASILLPYLDAKLKFGSITTMLTKDLLKDLSREVTNNPTLQRFLPACPKTLRNQLDRIAPNLKRIGIEVSYPPRVGKGAKVSFARVPPEDLEVDPEAEARFWADQEPERDHGESQAEGGIPF